MIQFKLDELLKREIEEVAKELKLNKSEFIRKAVMEYISRYYYKKEMEEYKQNEIKNICKRTSKRIP